MEDKDTKIIFFKTAIPLIDSLKLKIYLEDRNLPLHNNKIDKQGVWEFKHDYYDGGYKCVGIICDKEYYYNVYITTVEFFMKNNLII